MAADLLSFIHHKSASQRLLLSKRIKTVDKKLYEELRIVRDEATLTNIIAQRNVSARDKPHASGTC